MIQVKLIAVGNLKESYLKEVAAEYEKRLGAFCRLETREIRESRLPDNPSESEIAAALEDEALRINAAVPQNYYKVVLAVEGRQMSSPELAAELERHSDARRGICFIIGSSYGLSPSVKDSADLKLSLSKLTFPHRLFRVMLLETVYRSFTIMKGTKYHK